MCPENEFGQYEYKVQEKVTTKKIEHDLMDRYERELWIALALIPFVALFVGMNIWLILEDIKDGTSNLLYLIPLSVLSGFLVIFVVIQLIYSLYMVLGGYKRFYVAIDNLRDIQIIVVRRRKRRNTIYYRLIFNKCGQIQFVPETEFYDWSENYRMLGEGIKQSAHIGDRFFLIMRGKKILYFYNDRMFDLSETLKNMRVVGETPQPILNGESADNCNDQNGDSGEERIFH